MNFFNTIHYSPELLDNSWLSIVEQAADICRAPSRWVVTELLEGGTKYTITIKSQTYSTSLKCHESALPQSEGIRKICRIALGALLSLPGQILALPLMGLAFCSKEIRLKHQLTSRGFYYMRNNSIEKDKLKTMIEERVKLAKEQQGCEPVTCLLCCICCLLCCLVCSRK